MTELPDIQNTQPKIIMPLRRVGVSNVELPFRLITRDGGSDLAPINAMAEMVCNLDAHTRGISMSRFLRTLQPYLRHPLNRETLETIVKHFTKSLETDTASIKFTFKIPIYKKSPISDNMFPQYYECSFRSDYSHHVFSFYESVRVQYISYCPCSSALCYEGKYGYPHSQRSFADVQVETSPRAYVWLENIIDLVEKTVKTIPYPIVKRGDEKWIAGMAKNWPQFVEDSIRGISFQLEREKGIIDWIVRCTHEESIHTSNAIAINWKGRENGFDEKTYI